MNWSGLIAAIFGILLVFMAIRLVRNNPGLFTKENFGKSTFTLGILTLMFIAIVAICVWFLRN